MATAFVQSKKGAWSSGSTFATASITTTTGNLLVVSVHLAAGNSTNSITGVSDSANGAYTLIDRQSSVVTGGNSEITTWYVKNITGASGTITATAVSSIIDHGEIVCEEVSGADTTAPLDTGGHTSQTQGPPGPGSGTDAITSGTATMTAGDYVFAATTNANFGDTWVAGTGYTVSESGAGYAAEHIENYAGGSKAGLFTATFGTEVYQTAVTGFKATAGGIAFDAASNSGDQAASSNYTFNRTVTGTNTFLTVDVELLTVTGATVTSVTDDDGGGNVAMSFIGARSTVTGAGRVECWGLVNPTTGTKSIRVILSASIESVATAVSYTGVHQTSPTEGFNSNQATNAGSADNATVTITSVADNCWIHAACVANDTSISAGQTTRNNVAGTLGSGADEDNNAAVTPAGNTIMTYTGMGITATWAIAGYALRPIAASGNTNITFTNPNLKAFQLLGIGV